MSDEILDPQTKDAIEVSLRPQRLSEIIGRENEKRAISLMVDAAKIHGRSLDHILFYGPPGLGKTSMASVIAESLGVKMHVTSGPAIEKQGDLAALLNSLEERSVLFIDEIHRLKRNIEEMLYPAMEDGFLDIVIGAGSSAKTVRIDLPKFTLIGATTRLSLLSAPLQDRFGAHFHLDYYSPEEVAKIIQQKAEILKIKIDDKSSKLLASRSRRTARIAIRILKRAYDLAVIEKYDTITEELVEDLFEILALDPLGLDQVQRKYLQILTEFFSGKPVGLTTIAAAMGDDIATISEVIEPYLLREGLISKTPRGRIPTEKAINLMI